MISATKLQHELEKVLSGQPWYGKPIYHLIDEVAFETAYEKPEAAHSIAQILLHMLTWTEEVIDRLNGKEAGLPKSGNWPEAGEPDEHKWEQLVASFKLANVDLVQGIADFPADKWEEPINDVRGDEPVTSYEGLIHGFIQHQIYHAGQIAVLNRLIGGQAI